ncbi:MAG: hypothetical protein M3P32_06420 [Chloroflexota bacterium]|nr:hypothetical protein [Chloroflexota bacterium]
MIEASLHRIRLPRGTSVSVRVGAEIRPDEVIGMRRGALPPVRVPITGPLRRQPDEIEAVLTVRPGERVDADQPLALVEGGGAVLAPLAGLVVASSRRDGTLLLAPLGREEPVIGHVRGRVRAIEEGSLLIEVPAARLRGVGGSGDAVHGELVVGVRSPEDELRAAAIDSGATGKILVGGSRASAETLTRARAMGVAGIVLGGVLDKELRDFATIQQRRREAGGMTGSFGNLLVEGFGKVGIDPQLFSWFRLHSGRVASLFGADSLLYVYDASPLPTRRPLARVGERVIAHRRPFQGRGGVLVALMDDLHAAQSGIPTRMALVRFEDGRLAPVPLANLEATVQPDGR